VNIGQCSTPQGDLVETSNLKWPYQMGFWSSGGAAEEGHDQMSV
jgi:hypothetical protein